MGLDDLALTSDVGCTWRAVAVRLLHPSFL